MFGDRQAVDRGNESQDHVDHLNRSSQTTCPVSPGGTYSPGILHSLLDVGVIVWSHLVAALSENSRISSSECVQVDNFNGVITMVDRKANAATYCWVIVLCIGGTGVEHHKQEVWPLAPAPRQAVPEHAAWAHLSGLDYANVGSMSAHRMSLLLR